MIHSQIKQSRYSIIDCCTEKLKLSDYSGKKFYCSNRRLLYISAITLLIQLWEKIAMSDRLVDIREKHRLRLRSARARTWPSQFSLTRLDLGRAWSSLSLSWTTFLCRLGPGPGLFFSAKSDWAGPDLFFPGQIGPWLRYFLEVCMYQNFQVWLA